MDDVLILVMDDDLDCYRKNPALTTKHRVRFVFADPRNPIGDGLQQIRRDTGRRICAVISDCFEEFTRKPKGQRLFWHIEEIRRLRPDLTIAVHSGSLSSQRISLARAAGADDCFHKGESLRPFLEKLVERATLTALSPLDRFWHDLPELLESSFSQWVVYTSSGIRRKGDDECDLYDWCEQCGLKPGEYVVAQVLPDQPEAEVPAEWLPR